MERLREAVTYRNRCNLWYVWDILLRISFRCINRNHIRNYDGLAMLQTVYTVCLGKIRHLVSFAFAIHLVVERLIGSHVRRVAEKRYVKSIERMLPARDQIHREESRNRDFTSNVNKNVCIRMYTRYIRTWEEMFARALRCWECLSLCSSQAIPLPVDQLAGCKIPLCQDAEMILEMPTVSRAKKKRRNHTRRDISR